LQQIVWNLLTNAIKFTPPGGRVELSLGVERDRALIVLRDTGRGIAPDFLPHVFERFRQAPSADSRGGGLGLGLALARDLVMLHGGAIEADSPGEGRGATFTIRLPFSSAAAPEEVAAGLPARELAPVEKSPVEKSSVEARGLRMPLPNGLQMAGCG
jgi:signal transduction histidine kinase